MVFAPYCSVDGSGLLILPLVNGFYSLHAVLHNKWQRNAHSSNRQWLSRRFARRFPQRMAVHCSFFHLPMAFTVCAPYYSTDDSVLLILPLFNGFHGLRAVLHNEWQQIAHSSSRQRLFRRFACRFPQRMVVHSWFLRSSTAFTVDAPFSSADDSALLALPLVNGFHSLLTVLLNGWQWIARSSAHQRLSRFAHRIAQRMAADCSFFRLSTAFAVCAPFCSADDMAFLILLFVNGFPGLRAVLSNGWQQIASSSARQWLSRFPCRFPPQMTAHCSYFHSSMAFTTVCAPYGSVDGSGLLIPPFVNGCCDGSRIAWLSGWQRITCASACQWLLRQFVRRIAQRIVADCWFFRSSTAFPTVCTPISSADGSALLLLLLVNGFHGLPAVLLGG